MANLEEHRTQHEALAAEADRTATTRYGEAVNRYLGLAGYRPERPGRHAPAVAQRTGGLVVVGADDTPTSYTAVDHAAIEAEMHGWDLRIVHVLPTGVRRHPDHDAGSRLLERLTERVHACSPLVAVTGRLIVGSASALLLSDAQTADLVVVGHRHGAAGAAFGVTVGDRVAAGHHRTVLLVRVPDWPPGPEFGHRPLVVGVDHVPSPATAFAMDEARVRGCDVVMLRAGDAVEVTDRVDVVGGVRVHHRNVPEDPVSALVEASGKAAALVAGRTGVIGVPASLGSVCRALVQRAHCPVFLVG